MIIRIGRSRLGIGVLSLFMLYSIGSAAWAHGIQTIGGQYEPARRPTTWLEWFLPEAQSAAHVREDRQGGYRYIESDGLADHVTGDFPNRNNPHRIRRQNHRFRTPLIPRFTGRDTPNRHANFGVALNGVPFDPATAEFYRNDQRWNLEAIGGRRNLGLDDGNGHVQPNGAYHCHGLPWGMLDRLPYRDGPVLLGWAADGYPIYGPYGYRDGKDPSGGVVDLRSSYRLKTGSRSGGPGGWHDGRYTADWEYQENHGWRR